MTDKVKLVQMIQDAITRLLNPGKSHGKLQTREYEKRRNTYFNFAFLIGISSELYCYSSGVNILTIIVFPNMFNMISVI